MSRLSSFFHAVNPDELLYEGHVIVKDLGERMKRILFSVMERGGIEG